MLFYHPILKIFISLIKKMKFKFFKIILQH